MKVKKDTGVLLIYDNSRFEWILSGHVAKYGINIMQFEVYVFSNDIVGIDSFEHLCIRFLESRNERYKEKIKRSRENIKEDTKDIKTNKEIIKKIKKEMKK
jgi:hypothetical protein